MDSLNLDYLLGGDSVDQMLEEISRDCEQELQWSLKLEELDQHDIQDCAPGSSVDSEHPTMNNLSSETIAAADSTGPLAHGTACAPSPTCRLPSTENYPGPFEFDLELTNIGSHQTNGEYSSMLNKAFVSMGTKIPFNFKRISNNIKLYVRALLIFLKEDSRSVPVIRCPSHKSEKEKSNDGFEHVQHVIRCEDMRTEYDENKESGRLSVLVPLDPPQPGTKGTTIMFTFMCKNSCILGMDRKDTAIIFTLETEDGEVVGRRTMELRICSCPKRDRRNQENKKQVKTEPSDMTAPKGKKVMKKKPIKRPATGDSHEMVTLQIPVRKVSKNSILRVIREVVSMPQTYRDLYESEKITIEACNKLESQ